eukprot:COSAG04_NODE_849_length_9880_cov_57.811165_12_plen_256_part_00
MARPAHHVRIVAAHRRQLRRRAAFAQDTIRVAVCPALDVPELVVAVVAPVEQPAVALERHASAGLSGDVGVVRAEAGDIRRRALLTPAVPGRWGTPEPERAGAAVAPAEHRAALLQGEGVVASQRELDRVGAERRDARRVRPIGCCAVADLAVDIPAPEVDLAARRQRRAELQARGHLHHAAPERGQLRRRGVGAPVRRPEAELAVAVAAHRPDAAGGARGECLPRRTALSAKAGDCRGLSLLEKVADRVRTTVV